MQYYRQRFCAIRVDQTRRHLRAYNLLGDPSMSKWGYDMLDVPAIGFEAAGTVALTNKQNIPVRWACSANFRIVSSTNQSAVLERLAEGPGIVTAQFDRLGAATEDIPMPPTIISGPSIVPNGSEAAYTARYMPAGAVWVASSNLICTQNGAKAWLRPVTGVFSGNAEIRIMVGTKQLAYKLLTISGSNDTGGNDGDGCTIPGAAYIQGHCGHESNCNYFAQASYTDVNTTIAQYEWQPVSSEWRIIEHPDYASPSTMSHVRCIYTGTSTTAPKTMLRVRAKSSCGAWSSLTLIGEIGGNATGITPPPPPPPPAPVISGTSSMTVGTTTTFSASNMPSNGSWYAATSNISCSPTYGSSTVVSANSSGTATLQIRVSGSAVASKSITINNSGGGGGSNCSVPDATYISGNCGLESGNNVYYAQARFSGNSTTILEYQWEPTSSGWTITEHPNSQPPTMSRVRCTYYSSSPSPCMLRARARNSCGWSGWMPIGQIGGYSGYYSAYPNPTSSSLTIEINEALYAQQQEQQAQMMSAAADGTTAGTTPAKTKTPKAPTFDVRIYDQQGVLLRQQKCKGGTLTFNLSGLRAGVYLLKVDDGSGKAPLTEQIVVQP